VDRTPTAYLGQFTDADAEQVAGALEGAGIVWWYKTSGRFARTIFAGDWGVRLFVDEARLDEARTIAEEVTGRRPR
jgi:hypothetical protein